MAQSCFFAFEYYVVDVGGNVMKDGGMASFIKGDWSRLKKLYVSGCRIGDEGVLQFCKKEWPGL